MRRLLRDNGLSLVLILIFLAFWTLQAIAGWSVFNDEQLAHTEAPLAFAQYLLSAHFLEATAENWESEFLQMAAYVFLTAFLYQRGSAESKSPDRAEDVDFVPTRPGPEAPWPVRAGGWLGSLYGYSLSLAFLLLFLVSLSVHMVSGARLNNEERIAHGEAAQSIMEYASGSQFWFEAMQNWQSEFLAVFSIVILTIFLRQKGSPESKPVAMPHKENP
jgi:hypothetical protein